MAPPPTNSLPMKSCGRADQRLILLTALRIPGHVLVAERLTVLLENCNHAGREAAARRVGVALHEQYNLVVSHPLLHVGAQLGRAWRLRRLDAFESIKNSNAILRPASPVRNPQQASWDTPSVPTVLLGSVSAATTRWQAPESPP